MAVCGVCRDRKAQPLFDAAARCVCDQDGRLRPRPAAFLPIQQIDPATSIRQHVVRDKTGNQRIVPGMELLDDPIVAFL